MKKKDPGTIYDLALSEISETKITFEKVTPDFIHFMDEKPRVRRISNKKITAANQSWSLPGRTYSWFPYYTMHLISK